MTADPLLVLVVRPTGGFDHQLDRHFAAIDCPVRIEVTDSVESCLEAENWDSADAVVLDYLPRAFQLDLLWRAVSTRPWSIPVYLIGDLSAAEEAALIEAGFEAVVPPNRVDRLPIQIRRDLISTRAEGRLDDSIGDRFFQGLVTGLTRFLGVRCAVVGQIDGVGRTGITTLAASIDGALVPSTTYRLDDPPSFDVIKGQSLFVGERAMERYPDSTLLRELGAVSYFGLPLFGSHREPLGLLVLIDNQPLERTGRIERVTSLFATRAGAELERRHAEAQRASLQAQLVAAQKMEAIGTLAGGIAHDFNNVLMGILGNAEMAREELETWHPANANLAEILRAAHRAREVVQRMLTFSRKREPKRRPILLKPVIDELAVLLRATLPATIELEIVDTASACPVLADGNQVHQVVMNLVTNAAHAIGSRAGAISIREEVVEVDSVMAAAHVGLTPGTYVRLSVVDTGSGMESEKLDRIFEPFFTTKPPGEGTGLGLSVVHGIMQDHEGTVVVSSRLTIGSTFDLYFPALDLPIAPAGAIDADIPRGGGQHVLLVDDEAAIVRVGKRMLERLGYRVTAVTRAKDALERLEENPSKFQLVISDYTMPEFTGLDIALQIKQRSPSMPVLLTTGHPDLLEGNTSDLVGEVLPKPFATASLARAVHRLISRSNPTEPPGQ